jgi:hypothetical protein
VEAKGRSVFEGQGDLVWRKGRPGCMIPTCDASLARPRKSMHCIRAGSTNATLVAGAGEYSDITDLFELRMGYHPRYFVSRIP